jgi:hypothetical protein
MRNRGALKYLVLILAFILPGFVFFFLKKFGKNEFDVAPLYRDALPARTSDCPPVGPGPYRIPETILKSLGWSEPARLTLYAFTADEQQLGRIADAFEGDEVYLVKVTYGHDSLAVWSRCYLFNTEQKPLLLVDQQRQIRGHYFNTREEVDRLLTEAAIILKKY